MHESLRQRIERRLEQLPDETAYQVLDYLEFLESKYAERSRGGSMFQRLSETVEDTLRAGRLPVAAIKGTMNVMDAAGRVMAGLSAAGEAVIGEIRKSTAITSTSKPESPADPRQTPSAPAPAPPESAGRPDQSANHDSA